MSPVRKAITYVVLAVSICIPASPLIANALMIPGIFWVDSNPLIITQEDLNGDVTALTESVYDCYGERGGVPWPEETDCFFPTPFGMYKEGGKQFTPYGEWNSELGDYEELERHPYRIGDNQELVSSDDSSKLVKQTKHNSGNGAYLTISTCEKNENECGIEYIEGSTLDSGYYQLTWNVEHEIRYEFFDTDDVVKIIPGTLTYSTHLDMVVGVDTDYNLISLEYHRNTARVLGNVKEQFISLQGALPRIVFRDRSVLVSAFNEDYKSMQIFRMDACNYGERTPETRNNPCATKDIWNGTVLGEQEGYGLKDVLKNVKQPLNPRFVSEDTMTFIGTEEVIGSNTPKLTKYTIKSPGVVDFPNWGQIRREIPPEDFEPGDSGDSGTHSNTLKLLGMGDSYISGEGAVTDILSPVGYRTNKSTDLFWFDTNSAHNGCHTSLLSYPYTLGAKYFARSDYESVACSGATTEDIFTQTEYIGQAETSTIDLEAEKLNILTGFAPGYINQAEYVNKYQPENTLLSIGGNDIGFSDMVTLCVLTISEPCFSTKTERIELVKHINSLHDKLVNTYTKIFDFSPQTKLYVVGYPQVAKDGGNCGLNVHLDADEVKFSNQLIHYLNMVISRAAVSAGAKYVNIEDAFVGHRLCEADPENIAVHGLTRGKNKLIATESFHPNVLGHKLIAAKVAARTSNFTTSMPSATGWSALGYSDTHELVRDLPDDNLIERIRQYAAGGLTGLTTDKLAKIYYDAKLFGIGAGATFEAVIHSTPVTVQSGEADADGNIQTEFTLPDSVPPGVHTLHIYTKNSFGEDTDIQKIIYVSKSEGDVNGDGVPNASNECIVVPMSGIDADEDGIDDACDGDIIKKAAADTSGNSVQTEVNITQATSFSLISALPVLIARSSDEIINNNVISGLGASTKATSMHSSSVRKAKGESGSAKSTTKYFIAAFILCIGLAVWFTVWLLARNTRTNHKLLS